MLVSIPHLGREIPSEISASMSAVAANNDDCDWHLDRLYAFVKELGASVITPTCSRYVIDLNRPPDGQNLYPGQKTTGLVPVDTFDEKPLYPDGRAPSQEEIARRREKYWKPYHEALMQELARPREVHGGALFWDAHSIRSRVPRLFNGVLPDFNWGTGGGSSAAPGLAENLARIVHPDGRYSAVANGRFTGGYITRQYGRPEQNVHAVRLELSQRNYMEEQMPYRYDDDRAEMIQPLLQNLIRAALDFVTGEEWSK